MQLVPLKQALMNPEKYGDLSKRRIDYTPDYAETTIEQFHIANQTFETEMNHTWYAALYKNRVYFTTGELLTKKLKLCGFDGFGSGDEFQSEISKLYENKKLGIKGEIWTRDTVDIATTTVLPHFLRHDKKVWSPYWTAIKYKIEYGGNTEYRGLYIVKSSVLSGRNGGEGLLVEYLDGRRMDLRSYKLGIRPLCSAPENILVDIEDMKENKPLKITLPS